MEWKGNITKAELEKHNKPNDCWVVLEGDVYNVTPYLNRHPGGPDCIMADAGGDITQGFMDRHPYISPKMIEKLKIGHFVG